MYTVSIYCIEGGGAVSGNHIFTDVLKFNVQFSVFVSGLFRFENLNNSATLTLGGLKIPTH
jgi:hypothetical protein